MASSIKGIDRLSKKLGLLKEPLVKSELLPIGNEMIKQMKKLISGGGSTVRGGGLKPRMEAYKWAKSKDKTKYPFNAMKDFPGKGVRPVNLTLSGKMLKALEVDWLRAGQIKFKYNTKSAADKESGHREGVNTQPKRPTIPIIEQGEDFADSIRKVFDTAVRKRIREILKRR